MSICIVFAVPISEQAPGPGQTWSLEVAYLLARLLARVVRAEYELVELAHDGVAPVYLADLLRAASDYYRGHVRAYRADEHAGDDAVARGEQHEAVEQLHAGHYLDGARYHVAYDELEAEVRHPYRPHALREAVEVRVAEPRVVRRVYDSYERAAEIVVVIAAALVDGPSRRSALS